MKSTVAIASLAALAASLPFPLLGISAEDATRPTPPPEPRYREKAVEDDASTRGAVKAGEDQVLLPALRGLAIADTAESALKLQPRIQTGIEIEAFTARESAAIRQIAGPAIGKPVSLRSLEQLSSRLEAEFRLLRQQFVRISFPDQEITSGVIALRICPAQAGQVMVAGKPSFGMGFAVDGFRTRPGEEISGAVVLDDLEWLNENPLRRAAISYGDGAEDDLLDLTLRIRAEKSWRVYAGIDDQLSEELGNERVFIGYQHGNVLGLDHRFTGQYTSAWEYERLQGVSGIYEVPLPIRHLLEFSAGYTESESDTLGPLDQSGRFSRVALTYRVPLPRWQSIGHEWRAGIEFRNNDYLFPDDSSQTVKFFQIETGWKGRRADRYGTTRLDAALIYSPGQGVLGSEDEDFISLGASGAQSLIARLDAERSLKLGEYGLLLGRMRAQWADSDLLSSDQLSAGGGNRVRGFDETVGYASDGVLASIELQSRVFQMAWAGDWLGVCFVDGALLRRDSLADAGELLSAGVGLRWRYDDHVSAKLDLGFPLTYPDSENGDPLLHFAISTSW